MSEQTTAPAAPNGTSASATAPSLTPGNLTPGNLDLGGRPPPKEEPKTTVESITLPKDTFDERLVKAGEAAQRKFLKSLGFEKAEDLQTIIATAKTLQDEKKTEKERLEGRIKELEPKATRADTLGKLVESIVTSEFDKLDEKIRGAIDKVADGDAEKRWSQMQVLREAGLLGPSSSASPSPAPAPKTTAPPGGPAPSPAGGASKFKEWKDLQAKSPSQAAIFFRLNRMAIEQSRPADE